MPTAEAANPRSFVQSRRTGYHGGEIRRPMRNLAGGDVGKGKCAFRFVRHHPSKDMRPGRESLCLRGGTSARSKRTWLLSSRQCGGDRAVAAQGGLASLSRPLAAVQGGFSTTSTRLRLSVVSWDPRLIVDAGDRRSSWASVSESDGGTRLSFPSTDPGREVFQPNAVVGLCHRRASLPARRLRGPCPADRWSSRAPIPPCSSRPFLPILHVNVLLFMTTRIAFMAYLSSLTGMRRLAFAPSEWLGGAFAGRRTGPPRDHWLPQLVN